MHIVGILIFFYVHLHKNELKIIFTHNLMPIMTNRQPYTFDRVVRIVFAIVICGAILWLINTLSSVLIPFCIACLIAYLLEPLVQLNRRLFRINGRFPAIALTLLESLIIIVSLGLIFIPSIINETQQIAIMFKEYASAKANTQYLPEEVHLYIRQLINFEELSNFITQQNIEKILEAAQGVISGSVNFIMGLVGWFVVVLYIIFIMLDYEKLMRGFKRMVPPKYRRVVFNIGHDVKTSMNLYFRGQALVAFLVGVLFSIGFVIIGLPLAVVLGMFIGLLNMVPYLQFVSFFPATLLCLVYSVDSGIDFWAIWWECMAVYVIVQIIQDLFLVPRIMGKTMGLNPAIILLSLSIWGALFGFIGLIIALPLTTLLLSYYNRYVLGINITKTSRKRAKRQITKSINLNQEKD